MNRNRTLLLVSLVALPALASAQVASPKIVISNASNAELPLEAGSTVQVLSNGDLSVRCRVDAQGNCPSVGSNSSGSNPPAAFALSTTATSRTEGTAFNLSWNSADSDACVGLSPGTTVSGWTGKAFDKTGNVPLTPPVGDYSFQLRCFNAGGNRISSDPATQVSVTASTGGGTGPTPSAFCTEYKQTLPTPHPPNLTAFGLDGVEVPFGSIWPGASPGDGTGRAGVPGLWVSPAIGGNGARYLAIPVSLTSSSAKQQISLSWAEVQGTQFMVSGVPTTTGDVLVTVSPCAGDFRPMVSGSSDPYLTSSCRKDRPHTSSVIRITSEGSGLAGCAIPPNKVVYVNVATFNMYGATAPTVSTCAGAEQCGVSMLNQ